EKPPNRSEQRRGDQPPGPPPSRWRRDPVEQRQGRSADEDQRSRNRHDQDVLHHVDREKFMVKCRKRGTHGDPKRKKSHHEGTEPASWDRLRETAPDAQPASHVGEGREGESQRGRDFDRRMEGMWHRVFTAARTYDPPAPTSRALLRDASRAGD